MKKILGIFAIIMCFSLAACGQASDNTTAAPSSAEIETTTAQDDNKPVIPGIDKDNYPYIDGSTANHPLLARIYQEILGVDEETSKSLVDFDLGSTSSIWEKFIRRDEGTPDLLIVYEASENIKENYPVEMERLLEIEPLGRDGLVFLANVNNPVETLTVDELKGIYTDKIHNWSEVGGNDEAIKPFQRNTDSGSQTLFMKLLMNGENPMDPPTELKVGSMDGLIDAISTYDGSGSALGYSVYYYASQMYGNPNLKILSVNGVEPSKETIESGKYPLANDFFVVIHSDEPEGNPARLLRDWLLTDAGRKIVEETGYAWAR